jgi:hypothetical protein
MPGVVPWIANVDQVFEDELKYLKRKMCNVWHYYPETFVVDISDLVILTLRIE